MRSDDCSLSEKARRLVAKSAALFLVALFLLSGTASATNWVYLQRHEGTRYGPCSEYLDADSVVEDSDKLVYWIMWVLDETNSYDGAKKIMWKQEVPLAVPLKYRNLELYLFDSRDAEIRHNTISMFLFSAEPEDVARIREYARPRQGEEVLNPGHIMTPGRRWYGSVKYPDCDLYWDIHSITAWPQDNPTTVEITVKWVWNEAGLKKHRAFLQSQNNRLGYRYEGLTYTLVNYRFLTFESRMRMMSMRDFRADGTQMNLLDSIDWRDVEQGSKDEAARKIALNWLKNSDEIDGEQGAATRE
ncbi:MAG: hypothetical protein P4N59_32220 [Negativicutes bacterium]|nr:hypothetical protein [Negativicutes bacterium]